MVLFLFLIILCWLFITKFFLLYPVLGIIGARTSGVIVKTILSGGVADRDGRLKSGDHILQIGDVSNLKFK